MDQYTIRFLKSTREWVIDGPDGQPLRNHKTYIIGFATEQKAQDHCDALNSGEITLR